MKWLSLVLFLGVCLSIGFAGSVFTFSSVNSWYLQINKPIYTPPNWLFGPVWTTLFIMMGISGWLAWENNKKPKSNAFIYYFAQLGLNLLWSIIFFGLRSPFVASVEIIILWVFIFLSIKSFAKINKIASFLLYPYIIWVSFAAFLTVSIYFLNR